MMRWRKHSIHETDEKFIINLVIKREERESPGRLTAKWWLKKCNMKTDTDLFSQLLWMETNTRFLST
jgi:hypothetical protein